MTGGDIIEITFNHPTVGSGSIFAKSGEDTTFDPGGFRSADDENMVTGSGEMIDQMNNVRWSFEATVTWDMNLREELAKVAQLAASPILADWTISHINGTVYGGKGKPVGPVAGNANQATFTLKLAGGGALKKIGG
jgi:hypothetical protein